MPSQAIAEVNGLQAIDTVLAETVGTWPRQPKEDGLRGATRGPPSRPPRRRAHVDPKPVRSTLLAADGFVPVQVAIFEALSGEAESCRWA